jgi:hypothetical protein
MSKKVIFEGVVNKVSTLVDGSLSINIHTQELPEETMVKVFKFRKTTGMVLISSDNISEAEIKAVDNFTTEYEVGKTKTPSQRLRGVLYRYWEAEGKARGYTEFALWYEVYMEKIINKFKSKLDEGY